MLLIMKEVAGQVVIEACILTIIRIKQKNFRLLEIPEAYS